ncbi:MAG: hypothetical protein ABI666_04450 [Ferruginibacter sp.]
MELDDLKKDWEAVNDQTAKQNNLTPEIIDQMTKKKYYTAINKIKYPEWAGAIICWLAAAFIGFHFNRLDTIFFQIAGIAAILIFLLLPAISIISLNRFNLINDPNKPYAETLRLFAVQKLKFQKFQRANVLFSYLLAAITVIVLPKLFYVKDITHSNNYFWVLAFPLGYIFILFFSKWVMKFYNRKLNQAEELLKELES